MALPILVVILIRIYTNPLHHPENNCVGCDYLWQDFIILSTYVALIVLPAMLNCYKLATRPDFIDSFGYVYDFMVASVLSIVLLASSSILLLVDPYGFQKKQIMDWHLLECVYVFTTQILRVLVQLYRCFRIQRKRFINLTLLELFSDKQGSLLFENFLRSELAYENLQFWKTATKWKAMYDKSGSPFHAPTKTSMNDFGYTQQMARVLFRTFIGPHAQIPLNISYSMQEQVIQSFKNSSVISRDVFDGPLLEVYNLMEQGAFKRLLQTPQFIKYASSKADFTVGFALIPSEFVGDPSKFRQSRMASSSSLEGSPRSTSRYSTKPVGSGAGVININNNTTTGVGKEKISIMEYIESL